MAARKRKKAKSNSKKSTSRKSANSKKSTSRKSAPAANPGESASQDTGTTNNDIGPVDTGTRHDIEPDAGGDIGPVDTGTV